MKLQIYLSDNQGRYKYCLSLSHYVSLLSYLNKQNIYIKYSILNI